MKFALTSLKASWDLVPTGTKKRESPKLDLGHPLIADLLTEHQGPVCGQS